MSDSAYERWHDIPAAVDDPNALRGRKVLIMGLGLLGGGVSATRYAVEQGAAEVLVTDLRSADVLAESVQQLAELPVRYRLGEHDPADFAWADVVVRNPNVRRTSPYLAIARAAGKRIEMEIAWFMRACRGKIAGITGTRGKGTTTTLLHHILTQAGMDPVIGGNMGGIDTLAQLPEIGPDRWVVLEIGVWMLEGLHTIRRSPHLAVFTNLLPDHQDAFESMEDYGAAKTSIFRYQGEGDIALFNADNAYTRRYADEAPAGQVWLYSAERRTAYRRDTPNESRPFPFADAIHLRGAHNVGNVQAATLAAELIGIDESVISAAVRSYRSMPARLEVVRELDGVTYINDSASTAPVASVAALCSFEEPIVLIAGGNSKRLDFSKLAAEAAARARKVIVLQGSASEEFAGAVREAARRQGKPDPVGGPYDDFRAAVRAARAAAVSGDVVLLSPGFTSFGMFLNEFDRGDQYCALVRELE